jgi:hypothetical protein
MDPKPRKPAFYPPVYNTVPRDQPWLTGPTQVTQSRKGPGGTIASLDFWKSATVRQDLD